MPIDWVGLTAVVMGCLTVLIPIAAFSARFTVKPIVEAMTRLRESGMERETVQLLERRMALLEQEVHSLTEMREDIRRVLEAVEFDKRLTEPTKQ